MAHTPKRIRRERKKYLKWSRRIKKRLANPDKRSPFWGLSYQELVKLKRALDMAAYGEKE